VANPWRIWGRFVANLGQIRGGFVANLGQIRGEFGADSWRIMRFSKACITFPAWRIRGESVANPWQISRPGFGRFTIPFGKFLFRQFWAPLVQDAISLKPSAGLAKVGLVGFRARCEYLGDSVQCSRKCPYTSN